MSDRDKRPKAQDLFETRSYAFAKKVGFDEAFPEIADVEVEVEESGEGVSARGRKFTYTKQNLGERINCSNPRCYGGGFSIGSILRKMVQNRQTELETSEFCRGHEGSPKGRRRYRDCTNSFEVKVTVTYKETKDT